MNKHFSEWKRGGPNSPFSSFSQTQYNSSIFSPGMIKRLPNRPSASPAIENEVGMVEGQKNRSEGSYFQRVSLVNTFIMGLPDRIGLIFGLPAAYIMCIKYLP